jgi:predicted lipoprotein
MTKPFLFPATLLSTVFALAGCGGSGGSGTSPTQNASICSSFACDSLLQNIADNVVIPMINAFETHSNNLNTAITAWQTAPENAELKLAAQQAWNQAMLSWQSLEVVQTGPMLENSSLLRDSIYSWPSVSTCVVDQEVIEADTQGSSYDINTRTPLRKGLAALEYILYSSSLDHSCPSNTAKTQNWNARPEAERLALRLSYAIEAGNDISAWATQLKTQWASGDNSFRQDLLNAGSALSEFSSQQSAVNAISDALFYIEKQVKDIKLAEPLALKGGKCTQGAAECAGFVENPLSERSKQHLRQNLLAFEQIFLGNTADGTQGPGFDDLIDTVNGGENISAGMAADINSALNAIDALGEMTLKEAVTDTNGVNLAKGIHESTKKITDRLKNDFLNILGLTIPAAAAGDGD